MKEHHTCVGNIFVNFKVIRDRMVAREFIALDNRLLMN